MKYLGLFRDYGLDLYLFLNRKLKLFSICLKINFVKPHKISTHSGHSDNFCFHFFIGCLIELKFCEIHEILFQTDAKSFSFLS